MNPTVHTLKHSMNSSPAGTGWLIDVEGYPMQSSKPLTLVGSTGSIAPPRDLISKFRRGTRRSRGGCATCKARHVKCDEIKPCCKNCYTLGRKCEYVEQSAKTSSHSATPNSSFQQADPVFMPYRPSVDIPGTYAERRSFHYIQAKNLTETFGRCEMDLWDSTMLLYSHNNPAVRTSILALSAIYEVYESKVLSNDRTPISLGSLQKHTFTQYVKAVTEIIQSIRSTKRHSKDRKALLLSCLIFAWVEIMLSNFETAKWHLDSGINIINDIARKPESNIERDDPDDVLGSLQRSFLRLKIQTTVGLEASPMVDEGPPGDSQQASDPLNKTRSLDLVPTPTLAKDEQQEPQALHAELSWTLQGRRRQLERLRKADEAVSKKPIHTIQEEDRKQSLSFVHTKLSHSMLSLMTEAKSSGPNGVPNSRYLEVVEIVEDIFNKKRMMQPTPVTLDFGVNSPLYFTLRWCNDVTIKARAYDLLQAGWKEGLWYTDDMIVLAEKQGLLW